MTAKEWLDNSENAFVKEDMIEFAKYHVELALKEASEYIDDTILVYLSSGQMSLDDVKTDITGIYSSENIK